MTNTSRVTPGTTPAMRNSLRGIFLVMAGAFSFSVMFLLVKLMSDTNTFTLVFYRSLVQTIISIVSLVRQGMDPLPPPPEVRWLLVGRAVFGASAVCAWFFGIQVLPLPDAVTLQFTTPPFAALFAICIVGEAWKTTDQVGAVVCLTGVALIAHPTWIFESHNTEVDPVAAGEDIAGFTDSIVKIFAVLVTTIGAAWAGIAYVLVRKIGNRTSATVMVLYYAALSLPMCIVGSYYLESGEWKVWAGNFSVADYALFFLMGIAGYGGQWFTNLGLQQETAATATLATSTQIVWTYVFELLFLHEALDAWSLAGTALILGYMVVVAILKIMEAKSAGNDSQDEEKRRLLSSADVTKRYDAELAV